MAVFLEAKPGRKEDIANLLRAKSMIDTKRTGE
jgi:hypothetical protein